MNGEKTNYGKCSCGCNLEPVWFKEKERDFYGISTWRYHKACSYLMCGQCGKRYTVDDSFDDDWK